MQNQESQSLSEQAFIGYITAPSMNVAQSLARSLLESQSVACVNLIPGVESMYRWDGKIQCDREVLLMVKTTGQGRQRVIDMVRDEHPYDVPECIFSQISAGHQPYLSWLSSEVQG